MKRKLISYEVFESIQNNSLSAAEVELESASQIVAKALGTDGLKLVSYGLENVLYEDWDGNLVHANYVLNDNYIEFDNIEHLVIDEETEKSKAKEILNGILEAVLDEKEDKANVLFNEYVALPSVNRSFNEVTIKSATVTKGDKGKRNPRRGGRRPGGSGAARKAGLTRKRRERTMGKGMKDLIKRQREIARKGLAGRSQVTGKGKRSKRIQVRLSDHVNNQCENLCENVFDYIDLKEIGPILNESQTKQDEKGNIVGIRVPTIKVRNESKLISFDWKTLNTDVKVLRNGAKMLKEDNDFCKAVADLKRQNALSDEDALQESLEKIVTNWPSVLYLTQSELSETIKSALGTIGATNFEDQTCDFMAEGILRTAHNAYVDRVHKIHGLSGNGVNEESTDQYADFKSIVKHKV